MTSSDVARAAGAASAAAPARTIRVLIVSYYFPPAGGGGVQRVLNLCKHLPAFGCDVEVLAPDDPKWSARDPGLADELPEGVVVHRARYRGPSHEKSVDERLAAPTALGRAGAHARELGRRMLVPDPTVTWV